MRRVAVVTNVFDYAGPGICAMGPLRAASVANTPEALVDDALARFGRIDCAVSNDAGDVSRGPVDTKSVEDFRSLLERFAVAPDGISVNAIAPILLRSNYFPNAEDPQVAARVRATIPMQRLGEQDELAALVGLLASGKAAFVSGQVIAFSGAA